MPKKWFLCPDDEKVVISECIKECRMQGRCMSLPSLATIGEDRPYKGVTASAAGTGARQIYLKATRDYSVNPRANVFALYGSKHHALKEQAKDKLSAFLETEIDGGTCDFYDGNIIDYKFVGAYALSKRTIFEETDTGEVYKSGPKKGEPKFRKDPIGFHLDETDEWRLQLNRYRIGWEAEGFDVGAMFIEVCLRDGGLASSRFGFTEQVYMLPVLPLDDTFVISYYSDKQSQVVDAIRTGILPEVCTREERWDGRRCESYCDVATYCPKEDRK